MKEKQIDAAERPDDDNPELTTATARRARPVSEMLPTIIGKKAAEEIIKREPGKAGRPPLGDDRKVVVSLRLTPKTLEAFKATGKGWQTRIDQTLTEHLPRRK